MAKSPKNAKKQPYPVTVVDGDGKEIPPGTPVVIDAETSAGILSTFGPWSGETDAGSDVTEVKTVKVADLDAPEVADAIEEAKISALAEARAAFEDVSTLPEEADDVAHEEAMARLATALGYVDAGEVADQAGN